MSLTLYYHPLSSFCWKALIALYENGTAFTPKTINLGDAGERAELASVWPMIKFPVLRDDAKRRNIPESSTIIEYLALYYPGPSQLVPADPDQAMQVRLRDRFFDNYVMHSMQTLVQDRLRPADQKNAPDVVQARVTLRNALDLTEKKIEGLTWAMGDAYTMADVSASPSLFYADKVMPFADTHPHTTAYLQRLMARPSFARTLQEAEPFFAMFPKG
jgi:glutathione S-transferase